VVPEAPERVASPAESAAEARERGATRIVRGVVRDLEGRPVEGALVELVVPRWNPPSEPVRTDARGRYEFANVPEGANAGVRVRHPGAGMSDRPFEGERSLDFVLVPVRTVHGKVHDHEGFPAAGVTVAIRYVGSAERLGITTETDRDGYFEFEWRRIAVQELVVLPQGVSSFPLLKRRLGPEEEVGVLVLPEPAEVQAEVRGYLVGPDGAPAHQEAFVRVWRDGDPGFTRHTEPDEQGAFGFAELEPGKYRLEAHRDGYPTLHLRDIEVGPDGLDLGVLRLPAAAFIWVTDGGEEVAVYSSDQRIRYNVNNGCSEELNAGRYLLFAGSPGQVMEVELAEGQTAVLVVSPKPTGKALLEFVREDEGPPGDIVISVRDRTDRHVLKAALAVGESKRWIELVEGGYLLEAVDSRGRKGALSFDLVAGGEPPLKVLLRHPD
jgi:hypothetical protein